ncbi:MAG: mechanosensitive ion channel [Deltaproteobacteria bacterium]|nr:MAG: mechanosensitive ion channel [Deltaproteobacteria bacterium]
MDPQLDIQQLVRFVDWSRVPFALAMVAIALIGERLVSRFLDDLGERFAERRLLLKKLKALGRFLFFAALAAVVGSSVLSVDRQVMLALAGTLGLAVGFAFKDLLASLMAGVILLIDQPFQVGDRIAFGGYYGEVTEIGLRSVRLVTLDDNLVTIPNSKFITDPVASANAGALDCMVVMDFYIAPAEDFASARRLVAEAAATSRYVYLEKPVVTLLSDQFMGERFVTVVRVKAYVFDARYEKAFASDVTERVKRAFVKAGIHGPDMAYRDLEVFHHERPPDQQ